MTKFLKTALLLLAISIFLVACRETATDNGDDLNTEAGADINVSEDCSKVKIKTEDSKVKIKTDDDGNVTKKVKTDNDN